MGTGYKRVRYFSLPAETVGHIWLPPRRSTITCFLQRLLYLVNSFLQRLYVWLCFLPRLSAGSRIAQTVSAGSHFSWTVVSTESKRSRTVSGEAKYDGQSLQEAKISGLVYTCIPVVGENSHQWLDDSSETSHFIVKFWRHHLSHFWHAYHSWPWLKSRSWIILCRSESGNFGSWRYLTHFAQRLSFFRIQ